MLLAAKAGHILLQAPVQFDLPASSLAKVYKVMPEAVAKYWPLLPFNDFKPLGRVSLLLAVVVEVVDDLLLAVEVVLLLEAGVSVFADSVLVEVLVVEVVDGAEAVAGAADLVVVSDAFIASWLDGADGVVADFTASLAIAGAAANIAITNNAKNFFMRDSVIKRTGLKLDL